MLSRFVVQQCSEGPQDPDGLLVTRPADQETDGDLFDACLCELGPPSSPGCRPCIAVSARLVRNGGKVLVHINNLMSIPVGMGIRRL